MLSPSTKTNDLQRGERYIPMDFWEMMEVFNGESKITTAIITYDYSCLSNLGTTDGEVQERAWADLMPSTEVKQMPEGSRRCLLCGKRDFSKPTPHTQDISRSVPGKFVELGMVDDKELPDLEGMSDGDEMNSGVLDGGKGYASTLCICMFRAKL
ncbi:hypothetical protein R3P38DRAFT_3175540 [Favolaschia claudopus]|uniref:Uncharacterized protein n=1 Tax=Favolaschia claudopus TaxID=2862362 RepID=A0AAW0D1E6_9AGAR